MLSLHLKKKRKKNNNRLPLDLRKVDDWFRQYNQLSQF
jgi:hypothetical protein